MTRIIIIFACFFSFPLIGQDKYYNEKVIDVDANFFNINHKEKIIDIFLNSKYMRIISFDLKDTSYFSYLKKLKILEFTESTIEDSVIREKTFHSVLRNVGNKNKLEILSFYEKHEINMMEIIAFSNLIKIDVFVSGNEINFTSLSKLKMINIYSNNASNIKIHSNSCLELSILFDKLDHFPDLTIDLQSVKSITISRYYDSTNIKPFNIDIKNKANKIEKINFMFNFNTEPRIFGVSKINTISFTTNEFDSINKLIGEFAKFTPKIIKINTFTKIIDSSKILRPKYISQLYLNGIKINNQVK